MMRHWDWWVQIMVGRHLIAKVSVITLDRGAKEDLSNPRLQSSVSPCQVWHLFFYLCSICVFNLLNIHRGAGDRPCHPLGIDPLTVLCA